jgi:hypothetical protein
VMEKNLHFCFYTKVCEYSLRGKFLGWNNFYKTEAWD